MKEVRRGFLKKAAGVLVGVALTRSLVPGTALAAQQVTLVSRKVSQVPLDPESSLWQEAKELKVSLSSQVVVKPRIYNASVRELTVRSVYDEEKIGFLLEWDNASREQGLGKTLSYRDAVALQFPADPSQQTPYFAMGEPAKPVTIYHWKADWEFGALYDVNEEFPQMVSDFYPFAGKAPGEMAEGSDYGGNGDTWAADKAFNTGWKADNPLSNPQLKQTTAIEKLTATGFGNLTSESNHDGRSKAIWKEGKWRIALSLPRHQDQFDFAPGGTVPIGFAAWDGNNKERGGEKAVSSWYFLALEKPAPAYRLALPILAAAVIAALEWLILRRLKKSAS